MNFVDFFTPVCFDNDDVIDKEPACLRLECK